MKFFNRYVEKKLLDVKVMVDFFVWMKVELWIWYDSLYEGLCVDFFVLSMFYVFVVL